MGILKPKPRRRKKMRRRKKPQKKEREKGKILVIKLLKNKTKPKKNCTQYGFSVSYILTKTEILKVSAFQNFGLFCRFLPLWDPREEAEGGSLQGWGGAEEKDNPGQCEQEAVGRSPGAYIGGGTGR